MNFHTVSAIAAMICTVLATLVMLILCMASEANASATQIRMVHAIMIGFSLLSVAGIGTGILLLRSGQFSWALAVSIAPTVIMGAALLIALLK